MTTRLATTADVGGIVHFLHRYHSEKSNLSDIAFDRYSMTKCIEYYIGMPKHLALVNVEKGAITGCLLGSIEPFMFNKKKFWATDLLNVASSGGLWLTKHFLKWAKMHKVERVIMGVSTNDERSDRLYEALGMQRTGGMYMLPKEEAE
jgi:hypothetical protein